MKITIIHILKCNTEGQKLYFMVVWFPSLTPILKFMISMILATTKNVINVIDMEHPCVDMEFP